MTSTQPRIAAVIVSHNTRDEALGCLQTLAPAGVSEVLLVDAGSTDGTAEAVRASFPDATVMELENVGYGRSVNAAVAQTDAEFVVVANADTRFEAGSASELVTALSADPKCAAVGPLVLYPDGRRQASARTIPSAGQAVMHAILGLVSPRNRWTRAYRRVDSDPLQAEDVDWVSGCAFAVRRLAFAEVGGFDPEYFMFVEDMDLGYRLRERDWRVRYEPRAHVEHRVGASTRRRRVSMLLAHARGIDRFYGKVYSSLPGRLLRPLVRLGLAAWVVSSLVWGAVAGVTRGRSSTGE